MTRPISLPGFVNAHSHAFQRALRGRAAGGDFWAWREGMLEEASRHTAVRVRSLYVSTYREMTAAGFWIRIVCSGTTYSSSSPACWAKIASFS